MGKNEIKSYADFRHIIDELHDEIMVYDDNYRLVYVNRASLRHYGINPEDLIGKSFEQMDEVYWGNSTLPEVYARKVPVAKRQITNMGQDVLTIAVPIFDEQGNLKYVAQNVHDIIGGYHQENIEKEYLVIDEPGAEDEEYIYQSAVMEKMLDSISRIKNIKVPCLILGETGTGKSFLAKWMHNHSNRRDKPFISVNCACMNPNLVESELFGYKKGAFTGASSGGKKGIAELADGGTLFMDEISEFPFELQGKLLQFIQEQEFMPLGSEKKKHVDIKIIAATNKNIQKMIESGTFREDLYYRLNIFEVTIPPLRERLEDVEPLIRHYLDIYNKMYLRNIHISDEAMGLLCKYQWPGNIRELSHMIEKIVVLADKREIIPADLPGDVFDLAENTQDYEIFSEKHLDDALEALERKMITDAYEKTGSSVGAAKQLGISQPRAYRLIKKYILSQKK